MDLFRIFVAALLFGGIWFAANNSTCERCQDDECDKDGEHNAGEI